LIAAIIIVVVACRAVARRAVAFVVVVVACRHRPRRHRSPTCRRRCHDLIVSSLYATAIILFFLARTTGYLWRYYRTYEYKKEGT
jgi:hypothetical protein